MCEKARALRARLANNFTLGSCHSAVRRPHQGGYALQGAGNARWAVQDAWWGVYRSAHGRGLERIRKARTTHGLRTAEMKQMRRLIRLLRRDAKRLAERT
jgi:hypothetical protein